MTGRGEDDAIRVAAYYIWEREGRPERCALNHWARAVIEVHGGEPEPFDEEEKVLAKLPANLPALLTRDVRGG